MRLLAGRAEELRVIHEILARPSADSVVLKGPIGIGKTVLWSEAVRLLLADHTVLTCVAGAAEATLPFAALGALFREHLDVAATLPAPQAAALRSALAVDFDESFPVSDLAVCWAVTSVLQRLSDEARTVLCLDDIQYLDPATASALAFAMRRLGGRDVVVFGTWRAGTEIATDLAEALEPRCEVLELDPVPPDALMSIVRAHVGDSVPPQRLRTLVEEADGNPLAALEFARAELAGRRPTGSTGVVRLLDARLTGLDTGVRMLLAVLAVAGRIRATTARRLIPESFAARLAAAVDAELLVVEPTGMIRFAHPLFASTVAGSIPAGQRRRIHADLAGCEDLPIEQRALHASAATAGPDLAVAALLEEAAMQAARRGAAVSAGEFAELACTSTAPELDVAAHVRRGLIAAYQYYAAADFGGSSRALDFVEPHAYGTARLELTALRADLRFNNLTDVIAILSGLLTGARDASPAVSRARANLCGALVVHGDLDRAVAATVEAEALGRSAGDDSLVATALYFRYMAQEAMGSTEAEVTFEAGQAFGVDGTPGGYYGPAMAACRRSLLRGDLTEGVAMTKALVAYAESRGAFFESLLIRRNLVQALVLAGDLAAARKEVQEIASAGAPNNSSLDVPGETAAEVAAYAGDPDAASRALEQAEACRRNEDVLNLVTMLFAAALGYVTTGDHGDAMEVLREIRQVTDASGIRDTGCRIPWQASYVETATVLGLLDDAREVAADVAALAARLPDRSDVDALARRCAAMIAAAAGDTATALRLFRDLAGREPHQIPLEYGRTLFAYGLVARRAKQRGEARGAFDRAARLFVRIENPTWAARCTAESARAGGHARDEGLTPTERRVAEMVSQGHTNRAVATTLRITVKTVEFNLTSIYRKLGVRSRVELTLRMRGDSAPPR